VDDSLSLGDASALLGPSHTPTPKFWPVYLEQPVETIGTLLQPAKKDIPAERREDTSTGHFALQTPAYMEDACPSLVASEAVL